MFKGYQLGVRFFADESFLLSIDEIFTVHVGAMLLFVNFSPLLYSTVIEIYAK